MTSLDTNWDPSGRWASPDLSAAIAQAGLLLPNEAEAVRLSGVADLPGAVSALVAAGPRVVVKLGERGALCADGSVRCRVSLPPVTPADTTGAGDCFNAGLIAGLLDGLDLPRRPRWAAPPARCPPPRPAARPALLPGPPRPSWPGRRR